ncbi:MAG TPA: hypothetical protein ENI81_13415, partial [Phycisphaerales bacterium]|nr:hypothetical protein [Phycisphaerales bacterium]
MSRRFLHEWRQITIIVGLTLVSVAGCEGLLGDDDTYRVKIVPEKLHHIETLELEKASEQARDVVADANEEPAEEITLTLEQCRALTLGNNLDLKVQLVNPAIAAERISQEEARFEALFSANGGVGKTDTPVPSTLDIAGSNVDYSYSGLGVRVPLRTGGTVNFDIADNRTKTDSLFAVFNPSYSSDMSLSLSQPLLRNAGHRVNTY